MLIFTRRIGEEILIDKGSIRIKLLNIKNGQVAVGIQAPKSIDVDRKEIYRRKHAKDALRAKTIAFLENDRL